MVLYRSATSGAPAAQLRDGEKWWTTPHGRWRLATESKAMERFPGFTLHESADGNLVWAGALRSTFNRRRRYLVTVTYPHTYPCEAPVVTIVSPKLEREAPHLLSGNRPCLYRSGDGPRNGYDPARTTAATLVAWTSLWIHAYETWKKTGSWPGSES